MKYWSKYIFTGMHKFAPIQTLLLLVFIFSFRSDKQASITIVAEMCDDDRPGGSPIKLFRDGKLVGKKDCGGDCEFTNLGYGHYTVTYKSIFDTEETTVVEITEAKAYEIKVCLNQMDHTKSNFKSFIDRLQLNEQYDLLMESEGCFHSLADTFQVMRTGEGYFANWNGQKKMLNEEEKTLIRNFEDELNHIHGRHCTTIDKYRLRYKEETRLKAVDGTCSWRGLYGLVEKLFKK